MFLGELQRSHICIEMSEYTTSFDSYGVEYCFHIPFLLMHESFGFFFNLMYVGGITPVCYPHIIKEFTLLY
ncbi:hypothetical protein EZS27_009828 [termite gut metagenome]|uniref:Uncharacterized protein n=1 Tax=termite gut metagenome TaxID=433724 RepID=A0A5J4S8L0_9ZZZZ